MMFIVCLKWKIIFFERRTNSIYTHSCTMYRMITISSAKPKLCKIESLVVDVVFIDFFITTNTSFT